MDIRKTVNDKEMIVKLTGKLDISSAPVLAEELEGIPEDIMVMVYDLSELRYISSAGLRVLFQAHMQMLERGGQMIIRHADEFVLEVLEGVGFLDDFTIEK